MPKEIPRFREAEVDYSHTKDMPPDAFTDLKVKCKYEIVHLQDGKKAEGEVAVSSEINGFRLINHWNQDPRWKYYVKECRK